MSATTQDQEAFLVRLRRDREASDKLAAEREKLAAERETRVQEALKLSRNRVLAPVIALGGIVIGGIVIGGLGLVVGILGLTLRH